MRMCTGSAVVGLVVAMAGTGVALGQYGGAGPTSTPPAPAKPAPAKPAPAKPAPAKPAPAKPAPAKPAETEPGIPRLGDVDLRPKFRAGQQTRYVFEQTSKNQVSSLDGGAETDQKQEQNNRIGLVVKVVESGEAGATVQVVYESIKVSIKSGDEVMEFDSQKIAKKPAAAPPAGRPDADADPLGAIGDLDAGGMLGLIVGPMVGTTITVKTDHNGAITSVSGGESLGGGLGGLGGAGAGLVPSPRPVANWLGVGVGGKSSARVGETWTSTDAMNGTPVGAFTMKTTHTLRSASGGMANLAFQGRIEPPSESSAPGDAGASAGQVKSAAYSGTYVWDTRGGALANMDTRMSVVLDGGVMGARARISADTTVRVRRQQ